MVINPFHILSLQNKCVHHIDEASAMASVIVGPQHCLLKVEGHHVNSILQIDGNLVSIHVNVALVPRLYNSLYFLFLGDKYNSILGRPHGLIILAHVPHEYISPNKYFFLNNPF